MQEEFANELSNAHKGDASAPRSDTIEPTPTSVRPIDSPREPAGNYDTKCKKFRDKQGHFLPNPKMDCPHDNGDKKKKTVPEVSLEASSCSAPSKPRRTSYSSTDPETTAFKNAVEFLSPETVRIGTHVFRKEELFKLKEAETKQRLQEIEDKCRKEIEAFRIAVSEIAQEDALGVCNLTSKVLQMCEDTTYIVERARFWRSVSMLLSVMLIGFIATFIFSRWQNRHTAEVKPQAIESTVGGDGK